MLELSDRVGRKGQAGFHLLLGQVPAPHFVAH
jgi:hypothetical protein